MAAELVGGAFLSAMFGTLFQKMASREVVDFFRSNKLNDRLLKKLKIAFLSVNVLLNNAEEKQIRNPAVKKWLDELIEATYDVEDLMDEIETEVSAYKQKGGCGSSTSHEVLKLSPSIISHMIDKSSIETKIKEILDRLKFIIEQKYVLDLKADIRNRHLQRLPAPLVEESSVYGRDGDKEAIISLLLSDNASGDKISVIPIVGMGGIGKTTLAQLVFDDVRVKKHFELKVWVTISDEFDVFKITKIIFERLTSKKCEIEDLYELQVRLKEVLKRKRFLFVHDDVWNENYALWDVLKSPFEFGADGSKIIVTTRSKTVASKMGNVPAYALDAISDEDCWRLFAKHAYNNVDLNVQSNLLLIAIPTFGGVSSIQCLVLNEQVLTVGGCLRVLSLSNAFIEKLPDSIGNLKLLKYLDLSFTLLVEVTDSICSLLNLQTLLLSNCRNLTQLPVNMGNLVNLRHLDIADTPLKEMPPRMCNMKDLRTLPYFDLGGGGDGSRIKELRELRHLRGTLAILGLENVIEVEDVSQANLKDKQCLHTLSLKWYGDTDDSQKEREVLDRLQPHANLKHLYINGYRGTRLSSWIGDLSYSNMVQVHLLHCRICCFFPPFGELPFLRKLQMWSFDSVVTVGSEFYSSGSSVTKPFRSLEILDLRFMAEWKEWSFLEVEEGGVFPRLRELYLEGCPKLNVQLPSYLPSLTTLQVWRCRQLMPLIPRADQQMDTAFPCLRTIDIYMCPEQESFLEEGFPSSVSSLQIFNCNKLESLKSKGLFQGLTSLEQLVIGRCQELRCLPEEGLPVSLSYLCISDCPLLRPRCEKNGGEDWPKIAHVPRIEINWELI
ncbi:hypothetical protein TIFTF001_022824 [Ficus carica]|uniref:Disease resistance RPP13-like protein 1 n=1 Tax=Ficus carica TaxID=3494 RepID=A0AA88AJU7_FICCA|nr:hypothetical protein TIFTF001_022824 [Ficus carica]